MDFLVLVNRGVVPAEALTVLAFGIIEVLAYSALGILLAGIVMTCLCDIFECRKWRQCQGRTETWQLMH